MSFLEIAIIISTIFISIGLMLILIRFILGPTIEDRIVSIDLFASVGISIIAIYSISNNNYEFLDIGIMIALLSFLGTVAFANYLERRNKR